MKAAEDIKVRDAVDDYMRRVAENRPYEDARDAGEVINEAFRRSIP